MCQTSAESCASEDEYINSTANSGARRLVFPGVSKIADRFMISETAAAGLCSATLKDIEQDDCEIVDRNQI